MVRALGQFLWATHHGIFESIKQCAVLYCMHHHEPQNVLRTWPLNLQEYHKVCVSFCTHHHKTLSIRSTRPLNLQEYHKVCVSCCTHHRKTQSIRRTRPLSLQEYHKICVSYCTNHRASSNAAISAFFTISFPAGQGSKLCTKL